MVVKRSKNVRRDGVASTVVICPTRWRLTVAGVYVIVAGQGRLQALFRFRFLGMGGGARYATRDHVVVVMGDVAAGVLDEDGAGKVSRS